MTALDALLMCKRTCAAPLRCGRHVCQRTCCPHHKAALAAVASGSLRPVLGAGGAAAGASREQHGGRSDPEVDAEVAAVATLSAVDGVAFPSLAASAAATAAAEVLAAERAAAADAVHRAAQSLSGAGAGGTSATAAAAAARNAPRYVHTPSLVAALADGSGLAQGGTSEEHTRERVLTQLLEWGSQAGAGAFNPCATEEMAAVAMRRAGVEPASQGPGHMCMQSCGKSLPCGRHSCPHPCHTGPCAPCGVMLREPITCDCGATAIQPPVPCGTAPPTCPRPCRKTRACGHAHPQGHSCHMGPCPPCAVLVTRECAGGHGTRVSLPCHVGDDAATCGAVCGKLLPCGKHTCQRRCHAGSCASPQLEQQVAAKVRQGLQDALPAVEEATARKVRWMLKSRAKPVEGGNAADEGEDEVSEEAVRAHPQWGPLFNKEHAAMERKVRIACRVSCGGVCGAPKRGCGHPCPATCHPGGECPAEPCKETAVFSCSCGRFTAEGPCLRGRKAGKVFVVVTEHTLATEERPAGVMLRVAGVAGMHSKSDIVEHHAGGDSSRVFLVTCPEDQWEWLMAGRVLPCGDSCASASRARAFGAAAGVGPGEELDGSGGVCPYAAELLLFAKDQPKYVARVERQMRQFLSMVAEAERIKSGTTPLGEDQGDEGGAGALDDDSVLIASPKSPGGGVWGGNGRVPTTKVKPRSATQSAMQRHAASRSVLSQNGAQISAGGLHFDPQPKGRRAFLHQLAEAYGCDTESHGSEPKRYVRVKPPSKVALAGAPGVPIWLPLDMDVTPAVVQAALGAVRSAQGGACLRHAPPPPQTVQGGAGCFRFQCGLYQCLR